MTPDTVHKVAQEIRHLRAILTSDEKWARSQPHSQMKTESFQRINFWRAVLDDAERKIATGSTQSLGATG